MVKRSYTAFLIALWLIIGAAPNSLAQEPAQQQTAEKQEKEKNQAEEKAVALLEQIVSEVQLLKLPENRIRIQIVAADLLWDTNKERARALFDSAAAGIIEMTTNSRQTANQPRNQPGPRGGGQFFDPNNQNRAAFQLRQDLVLTAARHDSALALQLLQATQSTTPSTGTPAEPQIAGRPNQEANLEQRLMAQIARSDPKLAAKSAEEWLDKGQYPNSLAQVLAQLQAKDPETAARLSEKMFKRLQAENLLAKQDASSLALSLLRPGPRPPESATDSAKTSPANPSQVLNEAVYRDLLDTVITAALKATPPTPGAGRGPNNPRGGGPNGPLNRGNNETPAAPTTAQIEQNLSRMLLMSLQSLMPQVDKYQPARATAVRQKMAQMGVNEAERAAAMQLNELMQKGTSESLLAAAATAPANMRTNLYQRAALKALDEGNIERARQIANQNLNAAQRGVVLQMVDIRVLAQKSGDDVIEGLRQALASLPSDDERLRMVLQLTTMMQTNNPKLALQILEEGHRIVSVRATSYQHFERQVQVAQAFVALDPARSFEVLDPGITQLNELLAAAALLSGFEVNVFRDGELPIQGGSRLTSTVSQYAEALAGLAKKDFDRAQSTADRFQLPEARILTKLTIARGVLGGQAETTGENVFSNRPFGPNAPFMRRQEEQ